MPLLLASLGLGPLGGFLERTMHDGPLVFVPTAATGLADAAETIEAVRSPLVSMGLPIVDLDIATAAEHEIVTALDAAGAVVVGAGNPFRLVEVGARSGFARAVQRATSSGVPFVGFSAGAMAAGPDLAPLVGLSPFEPADDRPLQGWSLGAAQVIAHRDRADRADRIRPALRAHGRRLDLRPLADDEALEDDGTRFWLHSATARCTVRGVQPRDEQGLAETFVEAARAAWWGFLDQLPTVEQTLPRMRERLAADEPGAGFEVAEVGGRIVGFVRIRAATDADVPDDHGELDVFYTRPEVWGRGVGRVLMRRALDLLAAEGFTSAVLWTEERNERPLALYRKMGWLPDGVVRERDYLGTPLRERRLTIEV